MPSANPSPLAIRTPGDFAAAFDVSRETLQRLELYAQLLRQWQKAVNLVAPSTLGDIWQRHFADSAQLLTLAPAGARAWTDLGSGAGFPGLVIAILLADSPSPRLPSGSPQTRRARIASEGMRGEGRGEGQQHTPEQAAAPHPDPLPSCRRRVSDAMPEEAWGEGSTPRITLIEANARKAAFLREVVRRTGIADRIAVDILSTKIETAATQASLPNQDVVSARALAPLDRLLPLAAPLFGPATVGLFMKGKEAAQEVETAKKTWDFNIELVSSRTDPGARIVVVRQPRPKVPSQPQVHARSKNEGK